MNLNVLFIPMRVELGRELIITLDEEHISYRLWETSKLLHPKVLFGKSLPPLIFLSNILPLFGRVPSSIALGIVSRLRKWGGIKLDLNGPTVNIFYFCTEHNIHREVQWIC